MYHWLTKLTCALTLCEAMLPLSLSADALPATLHPEPHQRDPYIWKDRHEAIKTRHQTVKPEYVVIGDSITHHWGGEPVDKFGHFGEDSWNSLFGRHAVTNMGFGFDYVDNAYYRVMQGELDGTSPRVIIVLIGTNNLGHRNDTPKACADNTRAFVQLLRKKCPKSTILLLGILPRLEKNLAPQIAPTNVLLARLADRKKVFFADPGKTLLDKDGVSPRRELMMDNVHLNGKGYEELGVELAKLLKKLDPKYQGGTAGK